MDLYLTCTRVIAILFGIYDSKVKYEYSGRFLFTNTCCVGL